MSNVPLMNESAGNQPAARMLLGEAASLGIARGTAVVCGCVQSVPAPLRTVGEADAQDEIARFDAAVLAAEEGLMHLQRGVEQRRGKQEAAIFEAQIALLRDPSLREKVCDLCTTEHLNVEAALGEAVELLSATFARMKNPVFRERAADLRDVAQRLAEALSEVEAQPGPPHVPDGTVLVARELLPSVIAQLDGQTIRGVVVEQGGHTAHSTILARARDIPLLIHVPDATEAIRTGDPLIVDGLAGRVFINPAPEIEREYDRLEAELKAHKTALKSLIDLPATTRDGTVIKLAANLGKTADAVSAAAVNADGAGLYRTEFVFLAQDHFPPEEEQYRMYRATADRLKPREVVIRVLDIGSDKLLSYFPLAWEANPSLGCRGTRLLLAHPKILHVQLRAILRLSATHPVSLLFPMVGGLEDLRAAKAAIERAKASLADENESFNPGIRIGAMIETPAAAMLAERLAREVDFLSIGTNDLVQYLLATDRTSNEVAAYYEPLHPAVLQALEGVAKAADAQGIPVSICGEMAGNPAFTKLLIGLGFRSLSVNPGELLEIKNAVRSILLQEAENFAKRILRLDTVQEIKDGLRLTVQT